MGPFLQLLPINDLGSCVLHKNPVHRKTRKALRGLKVRVSPTIILISPTSTLSKALHGSYMIVVVLKIRILLAELKVLQSMSVMKSSSCWSINSVMKIAFCGVDL